MLLQVFILLKHASRMYYKSVCRSSCVKMNKQCAESFGKLQKLHKLDRKMV